LCPGYVISTYSKWDGPKSFHHTQQVPQKLQTLSMFSVFHKIPGMLQYTPPSFIVNSWGDEDTAAVIYKCKHRKTYTMHSMDPKYSLSDKSMWTKSYFNYFTCQLQILQKIHYIQLIIKLWVFLSTIIHQKCKRNMYFVSPYT
jgi:hypothetical protein